MTLLMSKVKPDDSSNFCHHLLLPLGVTAELPCSNAVIGPEAP